MPNTEMEKIRDSLISIGYREIESRYEEGVIIARYEKDDSRVIHLEFGPKHLILGSGE